MTVVAGYRSVLCFQRAVVEMVMVMEVEMVELVQ